MRVSADRPAGSQLHMPFDLSEFYRRLHQSIGGSGPEGLAWDKELPDTSLDPDAFRTEYLWSEIASKFEEGSVTPAQRRDTALMLFRESEERCTLYNSRLQSGRYRATGLRSGLTLDAVLHTASRKIANLLGDLDESECDSYRAFGPGASFGLPRRRATWWHKFEANLDVNPSAIPLVLATLAGRPAWCRSLIEGGACIVPNAKNRLTTVPKSYKRDRVIAIEPLMGMYCQKGYGGVIRSRLKRRGIDLDNQEANQLGALVGSLNGSLSTIDLKAASDTISIGIVEQLMPPDWFAALEQCRSPVVLLPSGELHVYRKFSTMGNGYTFELESLIFWALCSAVLELRGTEDRRLLVYGDDLVVPSEACEDVIEVLDACGFEANAKKTHRDGPFRESCGKHFLGGFDVTPFYIKRHVRSVADLFLLHNNLVRWCARGFAVDAPYRRFGDTMPDLLAWVRSHTKLVQKPTICDGYGDDGFIGSFDEVVPRLSSRAPGSSKNQYLSHEHFAMVSYPAVQRRKQLMTPGALVGVLSFMDRRPSWASAPEVDGYCAIEVAGKRVRRMLRIPLGG